MDEPIAIKTERFESVNVSRYESGIHLSVWLDRSYASIFMSREQATELRDAINTLLGVEA